MCAERHRSVSWATRGGRGPRKRRGGRPARRSRTRHLRTARRAGAGPCRRGGADEPRGGRSLTGVRGSGGQPGMMTAPDSAPPRPAPPAEGALVHLDGFQPVSCSVLMVIVLGQIERTDLSPVAVHEVLGLLRRPLSARRLRRQALYGSTAGRAHAPGSLQRRPTRCTAVRGGRAGAAVSARQTPSREQHRRHRRQRADGVHLIPGHRFLLPNAWTVPGSPAPVSHSQRHSWATKTSQPSPGGGATPGTDKVIFVRLRSHSRDQRFWRAEAVRQGLGAITW